jgi:hypothetical protein
MLFVKKSQLAYQQLWIKGSLPKIKLLVQTYLKIQVEDKYTT